jgi:hypothetical protein
MNLEQSVGSKFYVCENTEVGIRTESDSGKVIFKRGNNAACGID